MKLTYRDSRNSMLPEPHDMKAVVFRGRGPPKTLVWPSPLKNDLLV